jgi:hypothetical protein
MFQSHVIFGDSRGNQCTAMCAAFLARCFVDTPNTWKRPVIDEVLIQGDRLYKQRRPFSTNHLLAVDEVIGELSVLDTLHVTLAAASLEQLTELQGRMRRNCAARDLKLQGPTDKGNMTVILDSDEYEKKVMYLIKGDAYSVVFSDQTKPIESELKNKLISLHKMKRLNEDEWKLLTSKNSRSPQFYGLPKIHKAGYAGVGATTVGDALT